MSWSRTAAQPSTLLPTLHPPFCRLVFAVVNFVIARSGITAEIRRAARTSPTRGDAMSGDSDDIPASVAVDRGRSGPLLKVPSRLRAFPGPGCAGGVRPCSSPYCGRRVPLRLADSGRGVPCDRTPCLTMLPPLSPRGDRSRRAGVRSSASRPSRSTRLRYTGPPLAPRLSLVPRRRSLGHPGCPGLRSAKVKGGAPADVFSPAPAPRPREATYRPGLRGLARWRTPHVGNMADYPALQRLPDSAATGGGVPDVIFVIDSICARRHEGRPSSRLRRRIASRSRSAASRRSSRPVDPGSARLRPGSGVPVLAGQRTIPTLSSAPSRPDLHLRRSSAPTADLPPARPGELLCGDHLNASTSSRFLRTLTQETSHELILHSACRSSGLPPGPCRVPTACSRPIDASSSPASRP